MVIILANEAESCSRIFMYAKSTGKERNENEK